MKKLALLLTFILFSVNVFSQKITIKHRSETIGNGNNNAIVATIYEASISEIEKAWKSLMKDNDAKVSMGGEIFADNAKIKGFDNTCDIYARIKNIQEKEHELIVAVDLGGTYLSSSHHEQTKKIENLLFDFAMKTTRDAISEQIKEEEKIQKKMIKEKERLVDEKEQLQKDIENYKNRISEAEKNIAENEKMQETKKTEIEKQTKLVEERKNKFNSVK